MTLSNFGPNAKATLDDVEQQLHDLVNEVGRLADIMEEIRNIMKKQQKKNK